VLRGRALPDGRFFQVSPVLESAAPFAVDDSSVVWIDGARDAPVVRRLRVRVPRAVRPDIAFRVHASRVLPGRVVVEWSLAGEVGSGTFAALREDSGSAGLTEVARGEVLGPGTYFFEDVALPAEGGRQRVRYFVSIDLPSGSLRFGPVAVLLPGRSAAFALEPASANPALGEVVFALDVPPLPGPAPATMDVFDCSGRRIRSVDRECGVAGRTRVVWDRRDDGGEEVGPGVYFVRVRVGGLFSETRKVVLLS
jgi:hypothetical protein